MRAGSVAISLVVLLTTNLLATPQTDPSSPVELGIDPDQLPQAVTEVEGVERHLFRDGRVYIGGQPSQEALARFKELGVTAVVNLRTPAEMENRERVPYDEAAAVEELGLTYVFIPLGGDNHPYTPEDVDSFAKVLSEHEGPVLLHCTMGWRASYLWAAYLIREHGYSLEDAMTRGETIAISPPPLAGLLGRELGLAYR
jgi:uncharacterized protein (TIGR01244 family)